MGGGYRRRFGVFSISPGSMKLKAAIQVTHILSDA
jgi:hypothetical protein